MKFQTYKQKMATLFKTANFPETNSNSILVTPMDNLSFDELHDLCVKDNILMVECPNFSFDFGTMSISKAFDYKPELSKGMLMQTDPLVKPLHVSSFKCQTMEDFYTDFWNNKDLFFFYSGVKVNNYYTLRVAKIEFSKIEKAVNRYEAIVRLNSKINSKNTVESIQEYVNSDIFKSDMEQANQDINDIAKCLWESMRDIATIEQSPESPVLNDRERVASGLPLIGQECWSGAQGEPGVDGIPLEELKHQNSGTEDLIITSNEHGTWIEKEKQDGEDTGSH